MKIKKAIVWQVKKVVSVFISHNKKQFLVDVEMVDGVVIGGYTNGIRTNYLDYFHEVPPSEREKHFNQIKKYVEDNIS